MTNAAFAKWSRGGKTFPNIADQYAEELLFIEKNETASRRQKKHPSYLIIRPARARYLSSRGLIKLARPHVPGCEYEYKLTREGKQFCPVLRAAGFAPKSGSCHKPGKGSRPLPFFSFRSQ